MPNHRPIYLYQRPSQRYSLLRGYVTAITDGSSIVPSWSNVERGFLVRNDRLPELLARAELQGVDVRLRDGEAGA